MLAIHKTLAEFRNMIFTKNYEPYCYVCLKHTLFPCLWVLLKCNTAENIIISILNKVVLSFYSKNGANLH